VAQRFIFFTYLLLGCCLLAVGQTKPTLIVDFVTNEPIAFAHVQVDGKDYFTDGVGKITLPKGSKLLVKATDYNAVEIPLPLTDTIVGVVYKGFLSAVGNSQKSFFLIKDGFDKTNKKYPEQGNFSFSVNSYSKISLSSSDIVKLKEKLGIVMQLVNHPGLPQVPYNHHIFLGELVGRWDYVDELNQKLLLLQSNSTGIDRSDLAGPSLQLNSFSVGKPFVLINGTQYINPLHERNFINYNYNISDSAIVKGEVIYQVKINPAKLSKRNYLKGYAWVNLKTGVFVQVDFTIAHHEENDERFILINKSSDSLNHIFPSYKRVTKKVKILGTQVYATQQSWFSPRKPDSLFKFSEVVVDYDSSKLRNNKRLLNRARYSPLTETDLNTYNFYRKQVKMFRVNNTLNFAERLAYGKLNFGDVNLVLNKLIFINVFEGIRAGLGLESEPLFNKKVVLAGYAGFGLVDSKWKYGLSVGYKPNPAKPLEIKYTLEHDVREPAQHGFEFDKQMYNSEALRRLQLPEVDYYTQHQGKVSSKLGRYTYLSFATMYQNIRPNYYYRYLLDNGNLIQNIQQLESKVSLRFSYGETFMKIDKLQFSMGTKYPELWLQYSTGLLNFNECNCAYNKIEAKVNFKREFYGGSSFGTQLLASMVNGNVPYPLLFNIKGSYAPSSAITYNSFETMRFQEFTANRFVALFTNYAFSPRYFKNLPSEPQLIIMHNMGIGALSQSNAHKFVTLKSIEKGYTESGAFLNNIFKIHLGGGHLGIGLGLFFRYGSYSNNPRTPNTLTKFSISYIL